MGWMVFSYNIYFEKHLIQVRTGFLKKEIFLLGKVDDKSIDDLTVTERSYLKSLKEDDPTHQLPMWAHIDIDEYCDQRTGSPNISPRVFQIDSSLYIGWTARDQRSTFSSFSPISCSWAFTLL